MVTVRGSRFLDDYAATQGISLEQVNPASIDLTLAPVVELVRWSGVDRELYGGQLGSDADLYDPHISRTRIDLGKYPSGFWVFPGVGILATTLERVAVPRHWVGQILLKSSRAREFFQSCMAGYFDNGFHGDPVLELYAPVIPIRLEVGMKVVQMRFDGVEGATRVYGEDGRAHYQGQRGITRSWEQQ